MKTYDDVETYIAASPKAVRGALIALRRVIKKAAPGARERVSYGMPFYEYGGKGIKGRMIYFAAFSKHISIFIMPWQAKTLPAQMKKYHVSKATYRFAIDTPLPLALIEKTVRALVKERAPRQKECSRGHSFEGTGPCPVCWPGRLKKLAR